ncbi:MAG: hypothetical protein KDD62_04095 [Bdellovibrionales bacterium]|nr:hypothetical protein [Bdellovibrionales bacterium]
MRKTMLIGLLGLMSLAGCADLNGSGSQYDYGYGNRYDSPYQDDYYSRRERERIRDERRELERERERLDRERERDRRRREQEARHPQPPAQNPHVDRCPPGWTPGRCSGKDRKKGCKDMRTSGGLGCRTR